MLMSFPGSEGRKVLQAEGTAQAKAWWQESVTIFSAENTESSVPLRVLLPHDTSDLYRRKGFPEII